MKVAFENGLFRSPPFSVEPGWIDYNGHLNMAFYHVLFDRTVDLAFEAIGIGPSYVEARRLSLFTVECHVCYVGEVTATDQVSVSLRVLGHDDKRIHVFEEMTIADGRLAATSEQLFLHVDLAARKAAPFPADARVALEDAVARQTGLPSPERAGRRIALGGAQG